MVLEKTLESPLDCKEIQPVHLKGNQYWIFLEGLMLKHKLQYFDHLMQRTNSLKRPWCGKDWRRKEKGMTEDEMVDGVTDAMDMSLSRLREWVLDRSLAYCSPWGWKESDTTERLNGTDYSHSEDRDNTSLARAAILLLFHSVPPGGKRILSHWKLILLKEIGNFQSCCQYGSAV